MNGGFEKSHLDILVRHPVISGSPESFRSEPVKAKSKEHGIPSFEQTYSDKMNHLRQKEKFPLSEPAPVSSESNRYEEVNELPLPENEKCLQILDSLIEAIRGGEDLTFEKGKSTEWRLSAELQLAMENPENQAFSVKKLVQNLGLSEEQRQSIQRLLNELPDEARRFLTKLLEPLNQLLSGAVPSSPQAVKEKLKQVEQWLKNLKEQFKGDNAIKMGGGRAVSNSVTGSGPLVQHTHTGDGSFSSNGEPKENTESQSELIRQKNDNVIDEITPVRRNGFTGLFQQMGEIVRPEFSAGISPFQPDAAKGAEESASLHSNMNLKKWEEFSEKILRQLSTGVVSTVKNGIQRLHIQLVPEHLGKVEINLTIKSDVLTAKLMVDNEMTRQLVESQLPQLKEAVEQHNKVDTLEVVVDERKSKQGGLDEGDTNARDRLWETEEKQSSENGRTKEEYVSGEDTGRRLGYNTMEMLA